MKQQLIFAFIALLFVSAEGTVDRNPMARLQSEWQNANTQELKEQFLKRVRYHIFELIPREGAEFNQTIPYMEFWSSVVSDPSSKARFADELLAIAEEIWKSGSERQKAINLIVIASKLPSQDHEWLFQEKVNDKFDKFYNQALQHDSVEELHSIFDALENLSFVAIDIHSPQEKINQLEDAEYLYSIEKFEEAKQKVSWVLRLDPGNKRAQRLLGMIDYQFAQYKEALSLLEGLSLTNNKEKEALGALYILSGNSQEGVSLLDQVGQIRPISPETYLRIGYGLLSQDQASESLQWFDRLSPNNEEAVVGRFLAAYKLESWKEVVDIYYRLSGRFLSLDAFQGMVIEALVELGEPEKAEEILKELLNKQLEPSLENFPLYFQAYDKKDLKQGNRFFIAALFSKIVDNNNLEALQYFQKIKNPTPLMEIEKAEVLIDLRKFEEAKKVLLSSQKQLTGTSDEAKINPRLLPLLALAYSKVGFFIEAVNTYKQYFDAYAPKGRDSVFRPAYAQALMAIRRYDLALDEYKTHFHYSSPTVEEAVAYLICLVHNGQFLVADRIAADWNDHNSLPFLQKLQVGRQMVITGNKPLIQDVLEGAIEQAARSLEENRVLLLLWLDLGDFENANVLVDELGLEFAKIPMGLLALAQYSERLFELDRALILAHRAYLMDPFNLEIGRFLERYERSLSRIQEDINQKRKEMEEEPQAATIQLAYAKDLLDLAAIKVATKTNNEQPPELQTVKTLVLTLADENQNVPEVFLLLGKVLFLFNDDRGGKKAYNQALRLDVSYVDAFKNLAFLYEDKNDLRRAVETIEQGIKFQPTNAELWQILGEWQAKLDHNEEAVAAFSQAIHFSPNNPAPMIELAKTYIGTHQLIEAMQLLNNAQLLTEERNEILTLKWTILYDPYYPKLVHDPELIKRQQKEVYDELHQINPKAAETLRPRLKSPDKSE